MSLTGNVYIISRRAWRIDDLESGSFEPILVSLDRDLINATFSNIRTNVLRDKDVVDFEGKPCDFEYKRKNWYYQYRIRAYELGKFNALGYRQGQ